MTWKEVILPAAFAVALTAACSLVGYRAGRRAAQGTANCSTLTVTVTDTLTVCDTVRISMPAPVSQVRLGTVFLPFTDTVRVHDTLFVRLEREQREYGDSTYTAWVSGVRPRLDSIRVFPATRYVTSTVTTVRTVPDSRHWRFGVGVQAGYGITLRGASPYAGLGVSFGYVF